MKKTTLLTIVLVLVIRSTSAQFYNDQVFLKNGSIINGYIVSDSAADIIIRDLKGNLLSYSSNEIIDTQHDINRYISFTGVGLVYGSALNEKPVALSVLTEHNIQFYKYFAFGGFIGTELLNELTIPVGANMKIYLPLKKRILFVNASTGYSFSAEEPQNNYEEMKGKGGALAMVEMGMMVPLNYHNSVFFTLGYRYNELNYTYKNWYYGETDRTYYYNRISLRIGICMY